MSDPADSDALLRRTETGAFIVEWYRLDHTAAIRRALAIASALLVPGSFLVAVAVAPLGLPPVTRLALSSAGFLLTAGGPAWAIWGLRRVITADGYIALRTDGILCDAPSYRGVLPWDDIDEMAVTPDGAAVRILLRDGTVQILADRWTGLTPSGLVARLTDIKRRALWRVIPGMR